MHRSRIRHIVIALGILLSSSATSFAQVSIGVSFPNVSIGINLPVYPELVRVPGYPVYYAPRLDTNFFFYDSMYWVYQDDNWYASSWYNGPWGLVNPEYVPVFILRIPVRYYRQPPAYFFGWRSEAPPRWGNHWGHDWEQRRKGWDRWDRGAAPAPAPLPVYQRKYSGDRYPQQVEQQHELQKRNYHYQPRDPVVRQHYQEQVQQREPDRQEKRRAPEDRGSRSQDGSIELRSQSQQRGREDVQRSTPDVPQQGRPAVQDQRQRPQPNLNQREQQTPRYQGREERQQGKEPPLEQQRQDQEQGRGRNRDRKE